MRFPQAATQSYQIAECSQFVGGKAWTLLFTARVQTSCSHALGLYHLRLGKPSLVVIAF